MPESKWIHAGEMNALVAGTGATVAAISHKYLPQFAIFGRNIADLVYGVAALLIGFWIDHDGISYFLLGFGFYEIVQGAVNVLLPQYATTLAPSGANTGVVNLSL